MEKMRTVKDILIERTDPADPAATALLKASHVLMQALFPAESNHFLGIDALRAPSVHFFMAKQGRAAIGCGALAEREGYGEVKSMFVAPTARGQRVGTAILDAIETEARAQGFPLLRLESGDTLASAHALYQRAGFKWRGPFGAYEEDPHSVFMEKTLD